MTEFAKLARIFFHEVGREYTDREVKNLALLLKLVERKAYLSCIDICNERAWLIMPLLTKELRKRGGLKE